MEVKTAAFALKSAERRKKVTAALEAEGYEVTHFFDIERRPCISVPSKSFNESRWIHIIIRST